MKTNKWKGISNKYDKLTSFLYKLIRKSRRKGMENNVIQFSKDKIRKLMNMEQCSPSPNYPRIQHKNNKILA